MALSITYLLITLCLIVIRKYQKKYLKQQKVCKISNDFRGVDLTKLQQNYDILNKMLDDMKAGKQQYDKKVV